MSKAFKKGDLVTIIGNWDSKGTAYFQHAIVHSCGTKRMVLTSEASGEELGRNFLPVEATDVVVTNETVGRSLTFKRLSDEEATALCLEMGANVIKYETEHFDRCVARSESVHYQAAIERSRAQLHEPRAIKRA